MGYFFNRERCLKAVEAAHTMCLLQSGINSSEFNAETDEYSCTTLTIEWFTPQTRGLLPKGRVFLKRKRLFTDPEFNSSFDETELILKRFKISQEDKKERLEVGSNMLLQSPVPLDLTIKKATIKNAVKKSAGCEDLIGDFSKNHALPLIVGTQPDLKFISVETMRDLIEGKYKDVLESYTVVDSRFPYEFEGGHITNAVNIYTREQYFKLFDRPCGPSYKRNILIFHCEFSKHRGPSMAKLFRMDDKAENVLRYPSLCFPEMYVLEGGYKKFFQSFPQYCDPVEYKPMLHPQHTEEMMHFKKNCNNSLINQTCRKLRLSIVKSLLLSM